MDTYLFSLINSGTANPLFDILMPALTYDGYLLIAPYLFYVLYRSLKTRDASGNSFLTTALWTIGISACSVVVGGILETILKTAIARVRPCHLLEGIRLLTLCPEGYSMPSGHAISSFAFAMPVFCLTRRYVPLAWRCYPLGLAATVAFSRVYVGVHYPADVIVGAAAGGILSLSLIVLYGWATSKKNFSL